MHQATRTIQNGILQIQNWDATSDSIYALAAVVVVYLFIVVSRDKIRR